MAATVELQPDYYLKNFYQLMDFVAERYHGLLLKNERQFWTQFQSCPKPAQLLYVRLLNRKGRYFRQDKLAYHEIDELHQAVLDLSEAHLLATGTAHIPVDFLLRLYSKPELVTAFSNQKKVADLNKLGRHQLEVNLLQAFSDRQIRNILQTQFAEPVLALQQDHHFNTYKLCFFGNLYQDMTEYVLKDLGLTAYENYVIDDENLPYRNRRQINQHLKYYACLDELEERKNALWQDVDGLLQWVKRLPKPQKFDRRLASRIARQQFTVARQLERLGALNEALKLYKQTNLPGCRERQARVLLAQGKAEPSLNVCLDIKQQPLCEQEVHFASSFGHRTAKKFLPREIENWPAIRPYRPPITEVTLAIESQSQSPDSNDPDFSVEILSRDYLASKGDCYYVENTLFNGLLGLLIWDLIFLQVPGVFYNAFQFAPSDFYLPEFVQQRKGQLEKRMLEMGTPAMKKRMLKNWKDKHGLANPLVNWNELSLELINLTLKQIPVLHLKAVFERILDDIRHHRSGFPDLILFPETGGYELIEVKGPGDSLQQNQRLWMRFFAEHDIPHSVLAVSYA